MSTKPIPEPGTLAEREPHPAAHAALNWLRGLGIAELAVWQESFSSCALAGSRVADICAETLRRVMSGESVSDRYLLGLAWIMRHESSGTDGAP